MELRRFFIEPNFRNGDIVTLTGDEFLHLKKVLRMKVGYKIIVCFNDGYEHYCTLTEISDKEAKAKIDESVKICEPVCDITLFPSVLKGGKLDLVIQKCVELGIKKVIPFVSHNTAEKQFNAERGTRISFEAAKQCGSAFLSVVDEAISFDEMLSRFKDFDEVCFFYEDEDMTSVSKTDISGKKIAIVVGSEGGFTKEEVDKAKKSGAKILSLGKRILRAETASIVACALILYKMGEMDV